MAGSAERCPYVAPDGKHQCGQSEHDDDDHTLLVPSGLPWMGMAFGEPGKEVAGVCGKCHRVQYMLGRIRGKACSCGNALDAIPVYLPCTCTTWGIGDPPCAAHPEMYVDDPEGPPDDVVLGPPIFARGDVNAARDDFRAVLSIIDGWEQQPSMAALYKALYGKDWHDE